MYKIFYKNITPNSLKILSFDDFNDIFQLMLQNRHKLFDDEYFKDEKPYIQRVYEIIQKHLPYFWIFYEQGKMPKFIGFCYLYDLQPYKNLIHSAFATICFKKSAYGARAFIACKKLLCHVFSDLHIAKIKAECYTTNLYMPKFLMSLGFQKEGHLKSEVISRKKLIDSELWGILNPEITMLSNVKL